MRLPSKFRRMSEEEALLSLEEYADWEVALAKEEERIRPNRLGLVQIQFDGLDEYSVYLHPNIVREFDDPEEVVRFLRPIVRDEMLLERGFALACNYRLANIDVEEGVAYPVTDRLT
jgi:hypothetical protein